VIFAFKIVVIETVANLAPTCASSKQQLAGSWTVGIEVVIFKIGVVIAAYYAAIITCCAEATGAMH
jgi:hypothetical protein